MRKRKEPVSLASIRVDVGVTQVSLAEALDVTQAEVSRIEYSKDPKVSTIRRYIESLGGELYIVAVVDGEERYLTFDP